MKLNIILSLFFVGISFFLTDQDVHKNDSIQYFYEKSRNKKVDFKIRLYYINKSIDLASDNVVDSLYLKSLAYKSTIYASVAGDYDAGLRDAMSLKYEAERRNSQEYIAIALGKLGRYSNKKKKYLDAYEFYNESLIDYKELKDSLNVIKTSKYIANIQNTIGAFIDAENTVVKALPYGETLKDKTELSWLYDILAIVNRNQKLYSESIDAHLKALEFEDSAKSTAVLKNNYAVTLIESERYLDAVTELEPLLTNKDSLKQNNFTKILDNYAYAKSKLSQPGAEILLMEALQLRNSDNDLEGQFASHIHLADHYESNKEIPEALFHIENAYLIAQKIKSPDAIVEALGFLVPFKKELFGRYKYLRDSIENANVSNRNQFAKIRYDFQEEEKQKIEALRLKAESDLKVSKSETQNLLLLFGILLVSLISIIVYYIQKQKARQKLKLSQLKERYQTETRLSKKVHDEVGNDIFYLMTQLENDSSLLEKNGLKLLDGLQNIYSKARDISREYTDIDTGDAFPEELLSLLNSFGNKEVKIITKQLEPTFWTPIDADLKSEVFRIVQELLTNMKKHSQASMVAVTFKKEARKLIIQYSDNGVGVDDEKLTLKSVENRIQVLQGVLTLDAQPDEGLQVSIIIPI